MSLAMNKKKGPQQMKEIDISPTFGNMTQLTPLESSTRFPSGPNSNIALKFSASSPGASMRATRHSNEGVMSNLLKLANYSGVQNSPSKQSEQKISDSHLTKASVTTSKKALEKNSKNAEIKSAKKRNESESSVTQKKTKETNSSKGKKRKATASLKGSRSKQANKKDDVHSKNSKHAHDSRNKRLEMNRIAAQLSRQRKKMKNEELEKQCAQLRKQNAELVVVNKTLRELLDFHTNNVYAKQCELLKFEIMKLRKQLELSPSINSMNLMSAQKMNAIRQQQSLQWRSMSNPKQPPMLNSHIQSSSHRAIPQVKKDTLQETENNDSTQVAAATAPSSSIS